MNIQQAIVFLFIGIAAGLALRPILFPKVNEFKSKAHDFVDKLRGLADKDITYIKSEIDKLK